MYTQIYEEIKKIVATEIAEWKQALGITFFCCSELFKEKEEKTIKVNLSPYYKLYHKR